MNKNKGKSSIRAYVEEFSGDHGPYRPPGRLSVLSPVREDKYNSEDGDFGQFTDLIDVSRLARKPKVVRKPVNYEDRGSSDEELDDYPNVQEDNSGNRNIIREMEYSYKMV